MLERVFPGAFPISCWQVVKCRSKVRLAFYGVYRITTHRRSDSHNVPPIFLMHKSIACSVSQIPPVSDKCSQYCFSCPSHFKRYFPCFFAHLSQRVVLTKLCTCQSVYPTHWFICYLTLRVPQLLGGGGGGVSCGGSEGFDGVICIRLLFQEHVSVDTRFQKVKLHQVLRRLT